MGRSSSIIDVSSYVSNINITMTLLLESDLFHEYCKKPVAYLVGTRLSFLIALLLCSLGLQRMRRKSGRCCRWWRKAPGATTSSPPSRGSGLERLSDLCDLCDIRHGPFLSFCSS